MATGPRERSTQGTGGWTSTWTGSGAYPTAAQETPALEPPEEASTDIGPPDAPSQKANLLEDIFADDEDGQGFGTGPHLTPTASVRVPPQTSQDPADATSPQAKPSTSAEREVTTRLEDAPADLLNTYAAPVRDGGWCARFGNLLLEVLDLAVERLKVAPLNDERISGIVARQTGGREGEPTLQAQIDALRSDIKMLQSRPSTGDTVSTLEQFGLSAGKIVIGALVGAALAGPLTAAAVGWDKLAEKMIENAIAGALGAFAGELGNVGEARARRWVRS